MTTARCLRIGLFLWAEFLLDEGLGLGQRIAMSGGSVDDRRRPVQLNVLEGHEQSSRSVPRH
jgi:hypothetical protein